jgi:uncharacterized membrane protein YjjB (DUF3815 family)
VSLWPLLEQSLWAGVAALGFAVLFNVPQRCLAACAFNGSLAFAVRGALVDTHLGSLELASLCAAGLISFASVLWGRRLHAPALVFVIPGVIPLVPGALAFRTVRDLLLLTSQSRHADSALLALVVTNGFKVMLVTGAMALGVALPSLVLRSKKTPIT